MPTTDVRVWTGTTWESLRGPAGPAGPDEAFCLPGGRLTIDAEKPVGAVGSSNSIYYSPYIHDRLPLWDGSQWVPRTFTGSLSVNIALRYLDTASPMYDVYARWTGSAVELYAVEYLATDVYETPTRAPVRLHGIYVDPNNNSGRYLGRVHAIPGGEVHVDSIYNCIANHYHRLPQSFTVRPAWNGSAAASVSFTHSSTVWAALNSTTGPNVVRFAAPMNTAARVTVHCSVDAGQAQFFVGAFRRRNKTENMLANTPPAICGAMASQNIRGTLAEGFFDASPWNEVQFSGRNLSTANATVWAVGFHQVACPATQMTVEWLG